MREQAQKELAALTLFIKESGDLMEKHNGMSDELTARADEQRKDAVVDLLGIYEGLLADYDGGLEGARADNAKITTLLLRRLWWKRKLFCRIPMTEKSARRKTAAPGRRKSATNTHSLSTRRKRTKPYPKACWKNSSTRVLTRVRTKRRKTPSLSP